MGRNVNRQPVLTTSGSTNTETFLLECLVRAAACPIRSRFEQKENRNGLFFRAYRTVKRCKPIFLLWLARTVGSESPQTGANRRSQLLLSPRHRLMRTGIIALRFSSPLMLGMSPRDKHNLEIIRLTRTRRSGTRPVERSPADDYL